MITYVSGDIFYSPARVLVIPVNTVGVMSKGLAYDGRRFYPEMFNYYKARCQADAFDIGHLLLYRTRHKWVLLFPIKRHFRANARQEHIEAGLKKFVEVYAELGLTSVSFPRLGTGKGKLDWEQVVRPLMEGYLDPLPISVYIHNFDIPEPFKPSRRNVRAIRAWLNGTPEHVPYERFWRDIKRLLKKQQDYQTIDGQHEAFQVTLHHNGRGLNFFMPNSAKPVYIAASSLADLWQYIVYAGYAMPQNFPSGLDAWGRYLVGLLWNLKYLHPVLLSTIGREQQVGLHYVPPVPRQPKQLVRTITPQPANALD